MWAGRAGPEETYLVVPDIDLRHLQRLTDGTGILQHAMYGVPRPHHGYCTDDNSRALIAAVRYTHLCGYDENVMPVSRFLAFMIHALNEENGRFRNFMRYDRTWDEEVGSEDSHGRSLWALGETLLLAPNESVAGPARELFLRTLPACRRFSSPRAWAFSLLGLHRFRKRFPEETVAEEAERDLAGHLHRIYVDTASSDFRWFEDIVTYDNARLSQALLLAGDDLGRPELLQAALESLDWLVQSQLTEDGHLSIVGNQGWWKRGTSPARFDQQPVDANGLVEACLAASAFRSRAEWERRAHVCFRWFLGENDLGTSLLDRDTGGCCDGLHPDRANANEGAESTLAYLLSALALRLHDQKTEKG